ncbi:MAG: hypothetical protein P8Y70_13125 [Candidatus Lokiarchaeota archaeon]
MFKKRRIREEFEKIFESGDEKAIKKMLKEHPWLLEERTEQFDAKLKEQRKVVAALGIMEDDLGGFVPISKIQHSLKIDFNITKSNEELLAILKETETLGLVKRQINGWTLTEEGGRVCDDYLNKELENFEI